MTEYIFPSLSILVDLCGCPNRCRHCWLGSHPNGNLSADDFKEIAQVFKDYKASNPGVIDELTFYSWWREPDFSSEYRRLRELEVELSAPYRTERFELLSTWRLAHDETYAKWAADNGPKCCQITFFGMEETTDWAMGRRGAFADQITATERCLEAGIIPRWQIFPLKRTLDGELDALFALMNELDLHNRCEKLGSRFEFFFNSFTPEGNGYLLDGERLEAQDIDRIPAAMAAQSRDGLELLGRPESELVAEMLKVSEPVNKWMKHLALEFDSKYNVYTNIAEAADWWKLGNLQTDGADKIMDALINRTAPAMVINKTVPLCELASRYGDPDSSKLYDYDDLICRFFHQWGIENRK